MGTNCGLATNNFVELVLSDNPRMHDGLASDTSAGSLDKCSWNKAQEDGY
jgi:hypothetical protein